MVTADKNALINSDKTGAGSVVSLVQLQTMPTITRSASDLTRLNPMSAISLDAIEQISVSLAPYDVTKSGFTGASVDAVTKSGTNKFTGSVFGYFRNSDMTGGKIDGNDVNRGDLSQLQTGFSIGGPLIKNKVFFFANFELEKSSDLGSYFEPSSGQTGSNISRVLASDMNEISSLFQSVHGYNTGEISGFKHDTDNEKGLLKINFNLSDQHKLAITYNFLNASIPISCRLVILPLEILEPHLVILSLG